MFPGFRLALAGAGLALGLFAAGSASAATSSPAMQSCSDEWAQLKADGKVPAGTTWPKFWSQCAKDYAAAHPDDKAAATDTKAAAPAEPPPAKTKSSAAKPATKPAAKPAAGQTAMQYCSDEWAKMKNAGTLPAGATWPKFWSLCAKDFAAMNGTEAAPAKNAAAPAAKPAAKPAAGRTAMQYCSDEWSAMKDAGKVPAGTTWPKFWSQCAKDFAAMNGTEAAPAKNAATPAAKPAAKPAAGQTAMQYCSDEWSAMKDAGKIPAGTTWPKFWSQCAKDYAAMSADEELGAPLPAPDVAAKINPDKPVAGKREPTPGQKAAWARMRACGGEWQAEKKAGTLPAGAKWPQYWSDCNKRLKAKGQ